MSFIRNNKHVLLVIGILSSIAFFFQKNDINKYPNGTHAWAQADHLAIAYGFYDNGLDFFHPQTYVLNKQFPNDFDVKYDNGITSADFPIHAYIPAILMKLTGGKSPVAYRIYLLIYSMIGFLMLFKLIVCLTNNYIKAYLGLLFAITSPLLLDYQINFLPSTPSIASLFIGLYFYFKYLKKSKSRTFIYAMFFLTLAALTRTTFIIPLLSVIGNETFLIFFKKKKINYKNVLIVFISLASIGGYMLYNGFLRATYGSIFLGHLAPIRTLEDFIGVYNSIRDYWQWSYFTSYQIALFISILVLYTYQVIVRKILNHKPNTTYFIIFWSIGEVMFFFAMIRQFYAHDYYILDTFYPLIVFLFIFMLTRLSFNSFKPSFNTIFLAIIGLVLLSETNEIIAFRDYRCKYDDGNITMRNFVKSKDLINGLGINETDKVLALTAYGPNIPFLMDDFSGYAMLKDKRANVKGVLDWGFKYAFVQKEFFKKYIYPIYPEFLSKVKKVAENDVLVVFVREDRAIPYTLEEFTGVSNREKLFDEELNLKSVDNGSWNGAIPVTDSSWTISNDEQFGIGINKIIPAKKMEQERTLNFNAKYRANEPWEEISIVLAIKFGEDLVFYNAYNMTNSLNSITNLEWKEISVEIKVPNIGDKEGDFELDTYLYNVGGNEGEVKDVKVFMY